MASKPLNTLIRHLHRFRSPANDGLTDAHLLDRFVQQRDEAAFETLVWRHGTMVLNLCLRVLHHEHTAEDAFQATFLTLVRKAGAIGNRESVGSWLYKVAYRIALRARTTLPSLSLPPEPPGDPAATDPVAALLDLELRSIFDEEVNRLPDRYHVAFVLCHLQGHTIQSVALVLGCPAATVGTRVARARQLLRRRLACRGYPTIPIAALSPAALSPALVGSTIKAVASGAITAPVANLTNGVLRTMFLTRCIQFSAVVLGLSLFGGVALLAHRGFAFAPARPSVVPLTLCPADRPNSSAAILEWKFVKGRPFYAEVTTQTHQAIKVKGNAIRQTQEQTFCFCCTPLTNNRRHQVILLKIEGVKSDIDIGGNKITFDSTRENPPSPLSDFYKHLLGAEFQVTLTGNNQVRKVSGREQLIEKSATANPALHKVLSQALGADAVRLLVEIPFAGLPKKPVRPGDVWTENRKLNLGSLGTYPAKYRYILKAREKHLDRIEIQVQGIRKIKGAAKDAAAGLGIKKGELRYPWATGTLLFDRAKGRTVCLELRVGLQGDLTLGDKDAQMDVLLEQTLKITMKTTDTNPSKRIGSHSDKDKEIHRLEEENERLKRRLRAVEEALWGEKKPRE